MSAASAPRLASEIQGGSTHGRKFGCSPAAPNWHFSCERHERCVVRPLAWRDARRAAPHPRSGSACGAPHHRRLNKCPLPPELHRPWDHSRATKGRRPPRQPARLNATRSSPRCAHASSTCRRSARGLTASCHSGRKVGPLTWRVAGRPPGLLGGLGCAPWGGVPSAFGVLTGAADAARVCAGSGQMSPPLSFWLPLRAAHVYMHTIPGLPGGGHEQRRLSDGGAEEGAP